MLRPVSSVRRHREGGGDLLLLTTVLVRWLAFDDVGRRRRPSVRSISSTLAAAAGSGVVEFRVGLVGQVCAPSPGRSAASDALPGMGSAMSSPMPGREVVSSKRLPALAWMSRGSSRVAVHRRPGAPSPTRPSSRPYGDRRRPPRPDERFWSTKAGHRPAAPPARTRPTSNGCGGGRQARRSRRSRRRRRRSTPWRWPCVRLTSRSRRPSY